KESLLTCAAAAAQALAEKPAEALRATKRLMKRATAQTVASTIAAEAREYIELLQSPDAGEAFAAFLEKRPPRFAGAPNGSTADGGGVTAARPAAGRAYSATAPRGGML